MEDLIAEGGRQLGCGKRGECVLVWDLERETLEWGHELDEVHCLFQTNEDCFLSCIVEHFALRVNRGVLETVPQVLTESGDQRDRFF